MLQQMGGIELNHVPYKSIPPALADVMGGQIQMVYADLVTGTPQVKSGKVRALGVTSKTRAGLLPEVPSIAETLKDFELIAWFALFAPAGTPQPALTRLEGELKTVLARADVKDRFKSMGIDVAPMTPKELSAFQKSELQKWASLANAAGIQPQ